MPIASHLDVTLVDVPEQHVLKVALTARLEEFPRIIPENVLTKDDMLDNISVYWFTATAASSARLYWESFNTGHTAEVPVPSGISVYPREIFRTSRRWAERRFTDLRWFEEPDRGGQDGDNEHVPFQIIADQPQQDL